MLISIRSQTLQDDRDGKYSHLYSTHDAQPPGPGLCASSRSFCPTQIGKYVRCGAPKVKHSFVCGVCRGEAMSAHSIRHILFPARTNKSAVFGFEDDSNPDKQSYSIFRKPQPSPTIRLIDSETSSVAFQIPGVSDTSARKLRRDYFELFASTLILILPIPFFVLAFYAAHVEGTNIDSRQWQSLQAYVKISVTAFPILFAGVAGRAMKKIASWRLEDGARIGHLEQLMGSTSLGGTITSIFSLRLCNAFVPMLLLIWAVSPLGGQSSLHIVTTRTREIISEVNITYYDTQSNSVFSQNGQSVDTYLPTTNAIFQATIMDPSAAKGSTRDLWGNVRIPNLASIAAPDTSQSLKWTNITSSQNLTFSSLLGIPLSGLPSSGQTSLLLQTSYFTLTQDEDPGNISNLDGWEFENATAISDANGTWHWSYPSYARGLLMALDGFNAADGNLSLGYDVYEQYSPSTEFDAQAPRYLAIMSTNFDYGRIYRLSTTYVETKISCSGLPTLCEPTAIRSSQKPHINANLTNLAYLNAWTTFAEEMVSAVLLLQTGVPTITESYMNDPSTVAATSVLMGTDIDNTTATDAELQVRAQQLINTYWQASVNPAIAITGLSDAVNSLGNVQTRTTTGTHAITINVYSVNWGWWAAFTGATSIMLALALLALCIDCLLRGPELLGSSTALLRDSPFASARCGRGVGSAMGPAERARRWGDVRIKLADVRAGQDVGYVAVVEVQQEKEEEDGKKDIGWRDKLHRGERLYA